MSETPSPIPVVVALVRDLMFVGRIVVEARAVGVGLTVVREPPKLAPTTEARLLVVDLNLPGALEAAASWKAHAADRCVLAFVAHTDAALIRAARAASLDQVLPRSAFIDALPQALRGTAHD